MDQIFQKAVNSFLYELVANISTTGLLYRFILEEGGVTLSVAAQCRVCILWHDCSGSFTAILHKDSGNLS